MDVSKHPLLTQCYDLCLAIEECGASPKLTAAVQKASDLMRDIEKLTDAIAGLTPTDSRPRHLTPTDIEAAIVGADYSTHPDTTITICVLLLRNGAKVVGVNYGAIDAQRQDWEIGKREARAQAVEKVWELEGYALRNKLQLESQLRFENECRARRPNPAHGAPKPPNHNPVG